MQSGIGMDDGPVMLEKEIEILPDDNAITLFDKLSRLSADMVEETLDLIECNQAKFIPQDESLVSKCKMLKAEMGTIDFGKTASEVVGLIKGLAMWPNAHITIDGVYFKLYNAKLYEGEFEKYKNGEIVIANNKQGLVIKCSDGLIEITELLPINSKKMTAKSYLNGKQINIGSIAE